MYLPTARVATRKGIRRAAPQRSPSALPLATWALALYFAYYNFCRMHKSIRMTPAMAAGIARKPWSLADLLEATRAAA